MKREAALAADVYPKKEMIFGQKSSGQEIATPHDIEFLAGQSL
jgi:hypothetical protein